MLRLAVLGFVLSSFAAPASGDDDLSEANAPPTESGKPIESAAPSCVWPLPIHPDGRKARISNGFGKNKHYDHRGVDFMHRRASAGNVESLWESKWYEITPGTPALALKAGTVLYAGEARRKQDKGKGLMVELDHGDGLKTEYHHMSKLLVKDNDKVAAGAPLGLISYGVSYKPGESDAENEERAKEMRPRKDAHLHFDYIVNGKFTDSAPVLKRCSHVAAPAGEKIEVDAISGAD